MFESLGNRLQSVFDNLQRRGKLTEADVDKAMREVRLALLEADVNYKVVKSFVAINAGISIVPKVAIVDEVKSGKLNSIRIRDFHKTGQSRMGVIYRKDRYLSKAAQKFLKMLEKNADSL